MMLGLGEALIRGVTDFWIDNSTTVLRQSGWASWASSIARPFRVLLVPQTAFRLLATKTYRAHGRGVLAPSLLHFAFSKNYLRQGLSLRQRAKFALDHVSIEESMFGEAYFDSVYGGAGIELWRHDTVAEPIRVVLSLGSRVVPEGDLRIRLLVGDEPLHTIGFSFLNRSFEPGHSGRSIFVSRMQARWRKDNYVLDAFEAAFPQNSASYFAYAALQGVARALNIHEIVGVRAAQQMVFKKKDPQHFVGAYDQFWEKLGGQDNGGLGFAIPVPFHMTPLSEVPSKHRKRSRLRRENWQSIEDSCAMVLRRKLR